MKNKCRSKNNYPKLFTSNFPLPTYYGSNFHCDALGSPRKMTNESGSLVWSGAYYPFGEMIVGSGDVHGFTGKELDETGLNYFCQRYYDAQIGRFITMDKWTHLPDDERVFSYAKYLSWNNYQLKYNPQLTRIPKYNSFRRKSYTTSSDSLTNEINSTFPISLIPDFSDSVIYSTKIKNKILPAFRYYQLTEQFQNQLNGYRYCWNNPLKYVDPTGCGLDPFTMLLLSELFLGLRLGARFYRMAKELEPGYGYELNFGAGSLWFYMDYEGDYHWKWIWDISISGPPYN